MITTIISRRTGAFLILLFSSQQGQQLLLLFGRNAQHPHGLLSTDLRIFHQCFDTVYKHKNTPQPPKTLFPPQGASFRPFYGYRYSIFLWVTCSYQKKNVRYKATKKSFQIISESSSFLCWRSGWDWFRYIVNKFHILHIFIEDKLVWPRCSFCYMHVNWFIIFIGPKIDNIALDSKYFRQFSALR